MYCMNCLLVFLHNYVQAQFADELLACTGIGSQEAALHEEEEEQMEKERIRWMKIDVDVFHAA